MGEGCRGHGRGIRKEDTVLPTERVSGRFRRRGDVWTKSKDKCGHPSIMCVQEEDTLATLSAMPGSHVIRARRSLRTSGWHSYKAKELIGGQITRPLCAVLQSLNFILQAKGSGRIRPDLRF